MQNKIIAITLLVFFVTSMFSSQSAFAGGFCTNASQCSNDSNSCTGPPACISFVCVLPPLVGQSCNDGIQCTTNDRCSVIGVCIGTPNTGNFCGGGTSECSNQDKCVAGLCVDPNHKAIGTSCSGFNPNVCLDACDGLGTCVNSLPSTGNSCNDGFQCTTSDTCVAGACLGVPNTGMNCGDGPDPNGCSNQDFCIAGFCTANHVLPGVSCDNGDGQACTGSCSGGGTCVTSPGTGASCDDGNDCTVLDSCVVGACSGSLGFPGSSCDNGDGQACTGSCNVIGSCITAPATFGVCDDGNECTSSSFCDDGVCESGFGLTGDDCGAGGTECSAQDTCDSGTCVPNDLTAGIACGDSTNTACNLADTCDGTGICSVNFVGTSTSCEDGDQCTGPDNCDGAGACAGGPPVQIPACFTDDGDGIDDIIDTLPGTFSNFFEDITLGGTTDGEIVTRGDQVLQISDAANPDGVLVEAQPSGGPIPAEISACAAASFFMDSGDSVKITCSSIIITVINGQVDVEFTTGGSPATTTLIAGDSVTFDPDSLTVTTGPGTTIIVEIDGEETIIEENQTVVLDVTPITQVIGGELLPIDSTALMLAGVQTSAIWLAPVVISAVGIGLVLVRRNSS